MEKSIKPDRKYFIVCNWILLTISGFTILSLAIFHLIMYLAGGDPEVILVFWVIGLLLIFSMWIILYPLLILWIKNLEYIIREDRITLHKGIITKTQQNIPYRSITDFALTRGFFDRIIGIGSISIQTAGQSQSASGYEGTLKGLLDYEELQTELREKLKSLHPVSESLTTLEPIKNGDNSVLIRILEELKKIRQNQEKH
ncbi:MAG: PH domain-containing protein [Candidatus Neomarinimicrobiota bacterium]